MVSPIIFIIFTVLLSQTRSKKQRLINGGNTVKDIGEYPHVLYILFACPHNSGKWLCGGSILTQNIFLTAAHCLSKEYMAIELLAGTEDLNKDKGIVRSIDVHYMHEFFDDRLTSLNNDIALLATRRPLPLGRNLKRVFIKTSFPDNLKIAAVAGYGRVSEEAVGPSSQLKVVTQFIKSTQYCNEHLGETLAPGQLCAELDRNNGPTVYDSGGALIAKSGQQVGLVSYKIPAIPETIVYTNISYFYPWIEKHARKLYCQISKLPFDDNNYEDPNVLPD